MAAQYKVTVTRDIDGAVTRTEAPVDAETIGRVIALLPILSALEKRQLTLADGVAHLVALQTEPGEVF